MAYALEVIFLQLITILVGSFCFVFGIMCAVSDHRWNSNTLDLDRLDLLHQKYSLQKPFNYEEHIIIDTQLEREFPIQIIALVIYGITLFGSVIHLYLCFIQTHLYYRKHVNIIFHLLIGSLLLLIGSGCYLYSLITTNKVYGQHFDIIYEDLPPRKVPFNPCQFPQLEFIILKTLLARPVACHDSWTKILVFCVSVLNMCLYTCTACVIVCFVEEEDGAELLYKEMELVSGGTLPPVDSLPPLPYYCRPIADSPTSKGRKGIKGKWGKERHFNRVEVSEDWTYPP